MKKWRGCALRHLIPVSFQGLYTTWREMDGITRRHYRQLSARGEEVGAHLKVLGYGGIWRIIPFSKWLIRMVSKSSK